LKEHQKILGLTLSLLFASDITLKTDSMVTEYHSCHHSYVDRLMNPVAQLSQEHHDQEFNGDTFTVVDSIFGTSQLNVQEYNDIIGGYSSVPGFSDQLFKAVTMLYLNDDSSGMDRIITDFLQNVTYKADVKDLVLLTLFRRLCSVPIVVRNTTEFIGIIVARNQ